MKNISKKRRKIIMLIGTFITCIILVISFLSYNIYTMTKATTGDKISAYSESKAALIVIDMQNDTLDIQQYVNKDAWIVNINEAIDYATAHDMKVIYIKQEFKKNSVGHLLSMGKYEVNSVGAELSTEIQILSDNIYGKSSADSFSNADFESYLISNEIDTLYLAGADISSCVYKTSLGAVNRGYRVIALENGIFSLNDDIKEKYLDKMRENSIEVATQDEYILNN